MGVTTVNNTKEAISARNGGDTQISSRNDIFEQDMVDEEQTKEESARMDALMRNLLGGADEEDQDEMDLTQESQEKTNDDNKDDENDAFSFKLFSSAPLAEVNIKSTADDTANDLSKAVADQQIVEFDDTDPEFLSRVSQAALEFDTIMQQSRIPCPAMRFSRRVVHILENGEPATKKDDQDKSNKKKRKSKKYRDFQKAVADKKITVKPNMRNPQTPDGWPGWPGHRTRVAIIKTDVVQTPRKKTGYGRGGYSRGGFSRGSSRGGGDRGRGRGRGRGF